MFCRSSKGVHCSCVWGSSRKKASKTRTTGWWNSLSIHSSRTKKTVEHASKSLLSMTTKMLMYLLNFSTHSACVKCMLWQTNDSKDACIFSQLSVTKVREKSRLAHCFVFSATNFHFTHVRVSRKDTSSQLSTFLYSSKNDQQPLSFPASTTKIRHI